jgi:RNA polymerase sigma-70 factor (ECF subfamily)
MEPTDRLSEERSGTSTSRSLLARLHANDPAAWERLLALYAPLVWHWCRQMHLPHQEVADVFQEVFQAVAAHIRKFHRDQPGDTFRGWLRTITRNKVQDHFRRRQREPQAAGGTEAKAWWSQVPEAAWDEEGSTDHESYPELFHRALHLIQGDFEERTWRAFWRVVVDGQTPHDVATELAMSPGAVRVAKCRVLHRLRQELGDLTL